MVIIAIAVVAVAFVLEEEFVGVEFREHLVLWGVEFCFWLWLDDFPHFDWRNNGFNVDKGVLAVYSSGMSMRVKI